MASPSSRTSRNSRAAPARRSPSRNATEREFVKTASAKRDTASTMSEDNAEIVRRQNEAWNRPEAEIDWSRSRGPLKGVYRGDREREAFWEAFWSTFDDVHVEMHGFTEVGSEIVVPNTAHVRGRQGIEVLARSTFVFTVEKGQIIRLRLFQEQAEALEAVGLRE